jgi:hypothetical protein
MLEAKSKYSINIRHHFILMVICNDGNGGRCEHCNANYCDMTPESRNGPLLGNASLIAYP